MLNNFIVLYNKSGTNIAAAYITPSEHKRIGEITIQGFVADHVTYRYYADSKEHALYLTGVLNSQVVNEAIKPYQSRGLQGERDIHRRPFEVCPIPLFDPQNGLHRQIARVAAEARKTVMEWKSKIEGNAGQAREAARKCVQPELAKLNELVGQLLGDMKEVSQPSSIETKAPCLLYFMTTPLTLLLAWYFFSASSHGLGLSAFIDREIFPSFTSITLAFTWSPTL